MARAKKPAAAVGPGPRARTASSRQFSYKSFSQKIASLKIDPVRRVRRYAVDESHTKSYFRDALESWTDLNLSTTFVEFARRALPLSDSLPLILHHQTSIFDALLEFIGKRDTLSLEPLLDLLAHFAHDLGASFEPYFGRAVLLLSDLVARHVDVSTVEWTFGCLAYLLKYLSRLLVPDLRPLYDILAPLLGRTPQKPFNTRFAAEALSFLVRKTKSESLELIVKHGFTDLRQAGENPGYAEGLMTMFCEACTGVDRSLHSKAPQVFASLVSVAAGLEDYDGPCFRVTQGVLTSLIHHTNVETFQPIIDEIYGSVKSQVVETSTAQGSLTMCTKLLYTCVAVRKGSRVSDKGTVADMILAIINAPALGSADGKDSAETVWQALKAAAVLIQYAELDVVISKCGQIVDKARDFQDGALFLPFCEFVAETGSERFRIFVQPYFQRFTVSKWSSHEQTLLLLIPSLSTMGALGGAKDSAAGDYLGSKSPIAEHASKALHSLTETLKDDMVDTGALRAKVGNVWRYLEVILALCGNGVPPSMHVLGNELGSALQDTLTTTADILMAPLAGNALRFMAQIPDKSSLKALKDNFYATFPALRANATFLKGALEYFKLVGVRLFNETEQEQLANVLVDNLKSSDHSTRQLSLSCLELFSAAKSQVVSGIVMTAKTIEDIPLTVDNQRNIAMYIRQLATEYARFRKDTWESCVASYYCFGLLTVHFAPAWNAAIETMAKIAETSEDTVAELAFKWLTDDGCTAEADSTAVQTEQKYSPTRFECSNMRQLDEILRQCNTSNDAAASTISSALENVSQVGTVSVSWARQQALRVLCEILHIAEKRSRRLVPLFLECVAHEPATSEENEAPEEITTSPRRFSRKDQASMLALFSKFINPRVLYQADKVYAAELDLLKTGDAKIQGLALDCVLTWKIPAVNAYADNLKNLLDESRSRDELTNFVQVNEDESTIQPDHRPLLMPVLLRILYGRSLSRKHATSGKRGMSSTRTTVLAALANFLPQEREMFVRVALGDLGDIDFVNKEDPGHFNIKRERLTPPRVSARKQVGYVRMVEDMLKQLGTLLAANVPRVLDTLLYCILYALEGTKEIGSEEADSTNAKSLKALRQGGIKCLNLLFEYFPSFSWAPYMPLLFDTLITPRLQRLPAETAQGVSGFLQLFSTWASSGHTVGFLAKYNPDVLGQIARCLGTENVKDDVILFVLEILRKVLTFTEPTDDFPESSVQFVKEKLLRPTIDVFLREITAILRKSPGKDVLDGCIGTVAQLAPQVSGSVETVHLVELSVFLLNQPSRRVVPKAKSDILVILINFLPLCGVGKGDDLFESVFRTISSLFGFFRDRQSRLTLAGVMGELATKDPDLVEVGELSRRLNAFSEKRLDEPDFEQRLPAFAEINETLYTRFSSRQWLPIIYNMLFLIKDREEHAIRINATSSLKKFVLVAGSKFGTPEEIEYLPILRNVLFPALQSGMHDQAEEIRKEYVEVLDETVKTCQKWPSVKDLEPLRMGDDEEANFFNNILHIQQHRRLRALRRLAEMTKKQRFESSNIAHILLPLIEHYVFDQAEGGQNMAGEAVTTIGALVEQLSWPQYRALLRRYVGYIKAKPDLEKTVIRLIGAAANSLLQASEFVQRQKAQAEDGEREKVDGDGDVTMEVESPTALADSLPPQEKLAEDMEKSFLPTLLEFLHQKDETTVSLRVPVAIAIVKLLKTLSDATLRVRLPGVLTDVCHILRSRAQDSRDMTRRTLTEISTLLGPQYFSFIIKELRGALLRGYQLHVLSYTVHSLLVAAVPTYAPGDIDYCIASIVDIVMDDIFGVTGMEKDAEGYITKMKEVKSSKSFDTMEILASLTTLPHLRRLILPIRSLLQESLNLKLLNKIDELLRRITSGILKNETVGSQDLLVFCYQVVQEGYKIDVEPVKSLADEAAQRYIVNLKAPSKNQAKTATSSHVFKLTRFALELLRAILKKHDHLRTPDNVAGFVPVIGDAILSQQEEIQISALRLFTTIIRVPLKDIDEGADVFVGKALSFIKSCPSTNAELAQASLKLFAATMRDRKDVAIKETTVAYLLKRLKPDLEEPDRQGVAFNFIKAVMSRRFIIPEVYDILDQVAVIMVTNQTKSTRDLARGLYFQFLMDYPQGKDRFNKQLAFLVKNLTYPHQSGRQSVLEAMHLVLTKIGDNLIQDILSTLFVPLVMAMVNDESAECREMTGVLLQKIFERADAERRQNFLALVKSWLRRDTPALVRVSLQVFGLYLDVAGSDAKKDAVATIERLQAILDAELDDDADTHGGEQWELAYFSLQLWARIVQLFPETALAPHSASMWAAVRRCIRYPHAWVALSSTRLIGLLFAAYSSDCPLDALPLVNTYGLKLEVPDLVGMAAVTSSQLNRDELSSELGLQVVKNLLFLGRCFYAAKIPAPAASVVRLHPKLDDDAEEEEEEQEGEQEEKVQPSALLWLVGRISGVLRSERQLKTGHPGKTYALQWLVAMIQVIAGTDLVPLATKIMLPLFNLAEQPETPANKELKAVTQEAFSMLQNKMGVTHYGEAYTTIRQQVLSRRADRRQKRSIQMVADPEKAAKRKARKHELTRAARKGKNAGFREQRRGKNL